MESDSWQDDLWTAVSESAPEGERVAAMARLGRLIDARVFEALCAVATRSVQSEAVYRAAGENAGRVAVGLDVISEAPLHDFLGPAYLGFDAVVAAHLRGEVVT